MIVLCCLLAASLAGNYIQYRDARNQEETVRTDTVIRWRERVVSAPVRVAENKKGTMTVAVGKAGRDTVTRTKARRLHVGLVGGYGYGFRSRHVEPFMGLGVVYELR